MTRPQFSKKSYDTAKTLLAMALNCTTRDELKIARLRLNLARAELRCNPA